MRKIYFKRFAALAFMVSLGIGTLVAQTYSGGTGTSADPYKISIVQDLLDLDTATLQWAADSLHFMVTHDIDMTDTALTSIGTIDMPFMGTFDGNHKIISNLKIKDDMGNGVALFGAVKGSDKGGSIMNLGIENITLSTTMDTVGGIIGHLVEGYMANCYVKGGTVDGGNSVGGLVGAMSDTSMVKNCYAQIDVTGTTAGGLVGNIATGDTNNVSMCANYGTVNVGWIIADTVGIVTENCYYLDTANRDMNPMTVGLDSTLALVDTNYKKLDFNVWKMEQGGYAVLKTFVIPPTSQAIDSKGWKLFIDPEYSGDFGSGSDLGRIVDGKTNAIYESDWRDTTITSRKWTLDINMGRTAQITHLTYVPRQDAWGPGGTVRGYKYYITNDTSNWGMPVAQGVFPFADTVKDGFGAITNANDFKEWQTVKLPSMVIGTWIRFVCDSAVTEETQFTIAELYVTGANTHNAVPTASTDAQATSCYPNPGDTIQLSGSGDDLDVGETDKLKFAWIAPAGIELNDSTKSDPKWAADSGATTDQTYLFQLIVSDDSSSSAPDTVIYTVKPNHLPDVVIGKDQTSVKHGEWVPLSTNGTKDVDCHALKYWWTVPAGISFKDTSAANPTFLAPRVMADTKYDFTVTVSDPYGSVTATTSVTVIWSNVAPTADAGPPQEFVEHTKDTVWLDGSESEDLDGDAITYLWTAPAGIALSDSSVAMPNFVVTGLDVEADSVIVLSLVVNDGHVSSEAAMVNITILRDATAVSSLEAIDVSVYPNPSDGMFKVVSPSSLDVYVMDILGRTLFTDHFEEGMNTIDLSSFGQGLYILTVREGNNISSMKLRVK